MKIKKLHLIIIVTVLAVALVFVAVFFVKKQFSAKELVIEDMPAPLYASALITDGKPEMVLEKGVLYYTTPGSQECTPIVTHASYKSDHVKLVLRDCSGVTLFAKPGLIAKQAIYLPGYEGIGEGATISLETN